MRQRTVGDSGQAPLGEQKYQSAKVIVSNTSVFGFYLASAEHLSNFKVTKRNM